MKRILCLFLILSMTAATMGCGKKNNTGIISISPIEEAKGDASGEEKSEDMDMLGGVYPGGDELILIPMGGSVEGELEDLVTVGMPLNYTFLAMYSEDGDLNEFENASGEGSLASAIQFKFQEEPHKVSEVVLQSPFTDGSRIQYRICEDDSFSQFKDSVAAAENYTDVTEINGGQAFCYMGGSEEAEEDMLIACAINDSAYMQVSYTGPLDESLGREQLAENICNLIKVIE